MCCAAITLSAVTVVRLRAPRSVCTWTARTVPPTAGAGAGQLRFVPGWAELIASRSSVKCAALIGAPFGNRSEAVASVKIIANVAVTDRASFRVTVQVVAVPVQAPLQLLKRALASGAAVSVTSVPDVKLAAQLDAQLRPLGLLVTVPAAAPLKATALLDVPIALGVKRTVTSWLWPIASE